MLGKDLIVYIIQNDLLYSPICEDGKLLGLLTLDEAAVKYGVGPATIQVWVTTKQLEGVKIGNEIYVLDNDKSPMEEICLKDL